MDFRGVCGLSRLFYGVGQVRDYACCSVSKNSAQGLWTGALRAPVVVLETLRASEILRGRFMANVRIFVGSCLLLLIAQTADAGFYVESPTQQKGGAPAVAKKTPDTSQPKAVVFNGRLPAKISPSVGMAEHIPLKLALRQFVPSGWHGYAEGIDVDKQVSWHGAQSWTDTLAETMGETGYQAVVDWDKKTVTVQNMPATTYPMPSIGKHTPSKSQVRHWVVKPSDGNIRNTLVRWAKESGQGWHIFWEAPRWPLVEAGADFTGSFKDAVSSVAESYEGSETPIQPIFYANRAVRILPKGAKIK